MASDDFLRDQASMRREVLNSIFDENLVEDPEYHRLTRKHATLSMELEGTEQDQNNPFNRSRESIVEDLARVVEEMKRQHD